MEKMKVHLTTIFVTVDCKSTLLRVRYYWKYIICIWQHFGNSLISVCLSDMTFGYTNQFLKPYKGHGTKDMPKMISSNPKSLSSLRSWIGVNITPTFSLCSLLLYLALTACILTLIPPKINKLVYRRTFLQNVI